MQLRLFLNWLNLWSICVCHWFCIFSPTFLLCETRTFCFETRLCDCLHTEAKQWSGGSEDWKDVVLLKSTVSICLSVRCLAWLSSTERWWWQNDGGIGGVGGGRGCAHATECQFGCKAPFPQKLPNATKTKRDRAEVYAEIFTYLHLHKTKPTRSQHTRSDTVNTVWQPAMPAATI